MLAGPQLASQEAIPETISYVLRQRPARDHRGLIGGTRTAAFIAVLSWPLERPRHSRT
ncbi:MAG: hypothetical protein M3467_00360 [Actinomycetota bacterium]|nr:hypothetical protein [Actinomycetota bacterium]